MVAITWKGSPNYRSLTGVGKRFIVFHWMVGTLAGTDSIFSRESYKVSTQYGVGGSKVHQYVLDKDYAFGSGTTYANTYGISIEHEGGWMQANGQRFKPTAETHETSAQLCAQLAKKHGMGKLVPGVNAFAHSHFVSTQCCGTLDWKWICERANAINAGSSKPTPTPTPTPAPSPSNSGITVDGIFGPETIRALQKFLNVTQDGVFGAQTKKALQTRLGIPADGWFGAASTKALQKYMGQVQDGVWGSVTTKALQKDLKAGTFNPRTNAAINQVLVDGNFGGQTVRRLQEALGTVQDGNWGTVSKKLLQKKLGQVQDGNFGVQSIKALQTYLGIVADGGWGTVTTKALQTRLNANTF